MMKVIIKWLHLMTKIHRTKSSVYAIQTLSTTNTSHDIQCAREESEDSSVFHAVNQICHKQWPSPMEAFVFIWIAMVFSMSVNQKCMS